VSPWCWWCGCDRCVARGELLDRTHHPHPAQDRPPRHAGLVLEAPRQRPWREADLGRHLLEADLTAEPIVGPAQFR
jgi:hypothetical protein